MKTIPSDSVRRLNVLRAIIAVVMLACLLGFQAQASQAGGLKLWRHTAPKIDTLPMFGLGVLGSLLLALSYTRLRSALLRISGTAFHFLTSLRKFNWLVFLGLGILFPCLYLTRTWETIWPFAPRIWTFGILVAIGSVALHAVWRGRAWTYSIAATVLIYAVIYRVALFVPQVSDYLFSMGWSEASRYYNASLFFANQIYGKAYPLPTLHPTRYLLQSIPFLIPSLPLWFHRLWQVLLWLGMNGLAAWLLARRFCPQDRVLRWLTAGWAFLFFFQGPVYYHLIVCILLVVWGFDARRFWRSLAVVAVASVWAGISRINWLPVPGLLATLLYLIEIPRQDKPLLRYLLPPAVWTLVGVAIAFATQQFYISISGNPADQFSSSLSSDLLWYRLWPNITYPPGILQAILYVSLPLLLLFSAFLIRNTRSVHPIRWLGIAAILGVFLAGGIVVSIKIGGGSNLHNLDAFLALMAVVGAAIGLGRFQTDRPENAKTLRIHPILIGLILLVPAWTAILEGSPADPLASHADQQRALAEISQYVETAREENRAVLFINQRQLETFGSVPRVELVPDYEKVFLMEMVMSNNRSYLDAFYTKLKNHEFGLIVTEPLYVNLQDRTHAFSEENNVWMERVVAPILENYQPAATIDGFGIQLLVPKN
ncbi:hypothetical protein LARV_01699 [Longilinea arvoryzae]|uniref:Glycosyltransferase RgtA/B/C/D-like domain-containing protein n=1 Tax=Longilinea arvoryzae TaxID=360412 RepID=A0A0S7BG01_9CHLR|nr:hypothetical protein [Longilinea arvoryzae]GAP13940.1 hypothetical protein LARV_01699 [Longilinea arvoryzae]